mgnify:CR=1 FL=1
MANRKLPYNWENVQAGDIISFKYKSKSTGKAKVHSILVLNPSLIVKGQKKVSTQLIGIKLEESNKIQLEITGKQIQIFEQIGKFVTIDKENNLYKLDINQNMLQNDIKGIKPRAYDLLSKGLGVSGQYRTYDYYKARKSSVFLEPIRVFTKLKEEEKVDNKPKQAEKPKQPEKPKTEVEKPKEPTKPQQTENNQEERDIDKFIDNALNNLVNKLDKG